MNHIVWVAGFFNGLIPERYTAQHAGMHHFENNQMSDLSTTLPYKRDSFIDWLKYVAAQGPGTYSLLDQYLSKNNREKLTKRANISDGAALVILCILFLINWKATLFLFCLPSTLIKLYLFAINWTQHAFIFDPSSSDPIDLTATCINCQYNDVKFNDGYHLEHHLNPGTHWSEYPTLFEKNLSQYKTKNAIIFNGVGFFTVWIFLMTKNYPKLSKYQLFPITGTQIKTLIQNN